MNNEFITHNFDVSSLTDSECRDKLFRRYFIDQKTNLPNIYQLQEDLHDLDSFCLIIFNIDNFQTINNFYGLMACDYVVEEIGQYLKNNLKDHKVYSINNDEFAFVIEKNMFFYDLKEHLHAIYDKLRDTFVKYQESNVYIDFTLASSASKSNSNIFSKVAMALKYAKDKGSPFWIYEDTMNFEKNYAYNIALSKTVREAISNCRVLPYYQAIVDTKTSKVMKYECLARLIDSNGSIISPLLFIPVAKKIKYYSEITKIIIEKSFLNFEHTKFEFTINLSIEDIVSNTMFDFIMDKLKNSSISDKVTFEILESDAIEDFEKVEHFISEARRYGAKIAIDDFGSGYSNFCYLTKIKADYIKIDGSLVKNIVTDINSLIVVETIVQFAKKLGIKTIAEYVNSSSIMDKIDELDIDYAQGYYIHKPSIFTANYFT